MRSEYAASLALQASAPTIGRTFHVPAPVRVNKRTNSLGRLLRICAIAAHNPNHQLPERNTMSDNAEYQARAQVESICQMVAALTVDYDRLEELRDKAKAGHWVAGWNMSGYMPDDAPEPFEYFEDAQAYIAEKMRESDEQNESLADAFAASGDQELSQQAPDGYVYWINKAPGLSDPDEAEELAELESAAGDCESEDDARDRINEDPLSVEFRSDWENSKDDFEVSEFRIVLCTGGPHVEIQGDVYNGSPKSPRIIYRDWGASGELFDFDRDAVLTYCEQFIFD